MALAATLIASIFGTLPVVADSTPAQAAGNQEKVEGRLQNTIYAYARAGETVAVQTSGSVEVQAPDSTTYSQAGEYTADIEGIWRIVFRPGTERIYYSWSVDVKEGETVIPGRAWSNMDRIRQESVSDPEEFADLNYWIVNDTGYIYAVELNGYMGVNSDIQANSVGWADDDCAPTYASYEYELEGDGSGAPPLPSCGETYRVFYEEPAADLPAFAESATGQMTVLPPVLGTADLEVDDLAFIPSSSGSAMGTFTYTINPRFTGGYRLEIDVDGNGSYGDDVDRLITLGADGSGSYSYEFDGLDGNGDAIENCSEMNARIFFDKVGEVHIVQTDVEGREGGISVTRLNGAGAPDARISWNDTGMPGPRDSSTELIIGEHVDSTDGAHGWDLAPSGWGNGRHIDDWAYLPVNFGTGEIQISGQCLSVEKTSDATASTRVGDTVTYTVTATNTGETDYTTDDPAVVLDDLSGVLDDADFSDDAEADRDGTVSYAEPLLSWTGALPAGESVELTYSVTVKAGGDGSARNIAFASDCDPAEEDCDPPAECDADDPSCDDELFELPHLEIEKIADRTELNDTGESIEYTITVTNVGPGDYTEDAPATFTDDLTGVLDAATFAEDAEASTGEVSYSEPELTWTGVLAENESATVTYTATYTGAGDQLLDNVACVPETEVLPGTSACDSVTVGGPDLSQWKEVESSDSPAVAGSVLTYTLFFENDGEAAATIDAADDLTHVLDDADVTVEPSSEDGLSAVRDGNRIAITGSVPAGETYTVTYQVTLKADGERGDNVAANFLLDPEDETPPGPDCEPADDELPDCTVTNVPQITYAKSVEASETPVGEGTVLTYTITVENTGAATGPVAREDVLTDVLDDAELTSNPASDTDSVTVGEIEDDRFLIGGELAAGETAHVTYEVTVNSESERGNNAANNFLVLPGDDPTDECEPAPGELPNCTTTPLPRVQVVKDANPTSGTGLRAGEEVTYTLTFSNMGTAPGAVDYTDHLEAVLDDADLTVAPTSSDPTLSVTTGEDGRVVVTGLLDPEQTVTVSYTATVRPDGERGDNLLRNVVAKSETPDPECGDDGVECTEHPVGELDYWKTVDPASGTTLQPGTDATYTLHFENTGKALVDVDIDDVLTEIIDDAEISQQPEASSEALAVSEIADGRFTVSGELEAGESATVTYTATVKPNGERGDDQLGNFLVKTGDDPDGECVVDDPDRPKCTVNYVSDVIVAKSSDPESGTKLKSGEEVTYTLTFTNVSNSPSAAPVGIDYTDHMTGVLDDATLVGGPTASSDDLTASTSGDTIRITGTVPTGETYTVSYTVSVKSYDEQGDHRLNNVVAVTGSDPVCAPESPLCTSHDLVKGPELPVTGSGLAWGAGAAALVLLLGGAAVLLTARMRRRSPSVTGVVEQE